MLPRFVIQVTGCTWAWQCLAAIANNTTFQGSVLQLMQGAHLLAYLPTVQLFHQRCMSGQRGFVLQLQLLACLCHEQIDLIAYLAPLP